ncbi:MAG: aminotransferase class I/II-fold pyridoxal phosphate-dependent enzyme [Alphaproteobacteria bacterium]
MKARANSALPGSPFERLRELLGSVPPGADPIDMTIGEPRHAPPAMVAQILAREVEGYRRYPPQRGTQDFRASVTAWASQRYGLPNLTENALAVLPLAGSREGLFLIAQQIVARPRPTPPPVILIPNPFYQTYAAAALMAGAEPVYMSAGRQTGFLPDLEALTPEILERAVAMYLCSPANPQGTVATLDYWARALEIADTHNIVVIADECYSEIYRDQPPPGVLQAAAARSRGFAGVISFNSLSKRSNLPGLRAGFAAGDPELIEGFFHLRNVGAAMVPLPVQAAAAAAWRDESHVAQNRRLYNEKFKSAGAILGARFGYVEPEGGFFLWLDMAAQGGGEAAAMTLWRRGGVKVLPGAYLTHQGGGAGTASTIGADYVRLALVGDLAQTKTGLARLVAILDHKK